MSFSTSILNQTNDMTDPNFINLGRKETTLHGIKCTKEVQWRKNSGKKKREFELRDDLQDMRSSIDTHLSFHPLRNLFIPSTSNPRKIWREVYLWNNGLVNHHLLLRWHKWKSKHFYLSKLFGDVDNESIKLHTINKFRC